MLIDVTFDTRSDARGKDPDTASPTLRQYHRQLWSKRLPDGTAFTLDTATRGEYLHHDSPHGAWSLSSDTIIHTYGYWQRTQHLIAQIPDAEREEFIRSAYTIGGYLVFPVAYKLKPTINQARGTRSKIADRFDLTLECIRRHYQGGQSPLSDVLTNYGEFFALFSSFEGYLTFFLLDDLIDAHTGSVRFFLPFSGFGPVPVPETLEEYRLYRANSIAFVTARNLRIADAPEARASSAE